MNSAENTKIAGNKTIRDWLLTRKHLIGNSDPRLWESAYRDFFASRVQTRYFRLIELLEKSKLHTGEGFAIVAIQMSLIEFLESTVLGQNFRYVKRESDLGDYEYKFSGEKFKSFLTKRAPFSHEFDEQRAVDFYNNIRCAILHEARTKNNWLIRAPIKQKAIISIENPECKILYRNNLTKAFRNFFGMVFGGNKDQFFVSKSVSSEN